MEWEQLRVSPYALTQRPARQLLAASAAGHASVQSCLAQAAAAAATSCDFSER